MQEEGLSVHLTLYITGAGEGVYNNDNNNNTNIIYIM